MSTLEFTLPELGENVAGGDVLRVLVKLGDTLLRDQPVVELETDKATLEVPSSVEGRVTDVRVKPGQRIKVGEVVVVVESTESRSAAPDVVTEPPVARPDAPQGGSDVQGDLDLEAEEESGAEALEESAGAVDDDAGPGGAAEREPRGPSEAAAAAPAPAGPVEFKLPSLGENVPSGDVLRVLVKVGDEIERDQPVLELETDKATLEVPTSVAGRITEVRAKEGERINVGDVVLVVEASGGAAAVGPPALKFQRVHAAPPPREAPSYQPEDVAPTGGLQQRVPGAIRRPQADKPGMLEDALEEARAEEAQRGPRGSVVPMPPRAVAAEAAPRPAPAAPSVRRVARELGVEIHQVPGNGPGGRISADDVKAFVKKVMTTGGPKPVAMSAAGGLAAPALPDFSKWGEIERSPMRAVRRKTAEHLGVAWAQIPHVTQHDKADITALEELRKRFGKQAEAAGGKLTVTAIALKVVAAALKVFPQFNASIDVAAGEIVLKKYVHIGIAVDTDRGLIVPVIRDVDKKNIVQLSAELAQLSEKARAAKTSMEELQGGCFTITNLGGIGGTAFTPIVNFPEVAILGMSRSAMEPVYIDGAFQPRLMLPLSLSYDHRVIDGADAARFLRWVCEALEQPFLLALRG